MMRILVTGSSGRVGSAVADALAADHIDRIYAIDRAETVLGYHHRWTFFEHLGGVAIDHGQTRRIV